MCPQVADGGYSLQIWKVAGNVLIRSRGQPMRSGPSAWGLGERLRTPDCRNPACYKMLQRTSEMAGPCEHGNEPFDSIKGGVLLEQT